MVSKLPVSYTLLSHYVVIVQQQPQSVGEGLRNLFNNTVLDDFMCNVSTSTDHDKIECLSDTESISLSILPCNSSISMVVMDVNATLLNRTVFSMPHPQILSYASPAGDNRHLNLSVQVVVGARDGMEYYIVMLESSFGLQFEMTAIPLICDQRLRGTYFLFQQGN